MYVVAHTSISREPCLPIVWDLLCIALFCISLSIVISCCVVACNVRIKLCKSKVKSKSIDFQITYNRFSCIYPNTEWVCVFFIDLRIYFFLRLFLCLIYSITKTKLPYVRGHLFFCNEKLLRALANIFEFRSIAVEWLLSLWSCLSASNHTTCLQYQFNTNITLANKSECFDNNHFRLRDGGQRICKVDTEKWQAFAHFMDILIYLIAQWQNGREQNHLSC